MANAAKTLQTNAMQIMARLLLCAALVLGGSGCLFPQDDQVLPTLPPVKNRPPRIVDAAPKDQPLEFVSGTKPGSGGVPCDAHSFTVTVDDPDLNGTVYSDTIYSIWFIDKTNDSLPFRPNPIAPTTQGSRTVSQPGASAFRTSLSSLSTGTHLLTVFIADKDFAETIDGNVIAQSKTVTLPDGSEVQDPGYVDSYTWVLRVGPACQQ